MLLKHSEQVQEAGGGAQTAYGFAGHYRTCAFCLNEMGGFGAKEWYGLPYIIE